MMTRARGQRSLLSYCLAGLAGLASGCGDEIRVEITSPLPIETQFLYASMTMNPSYCAGGVGAACTQFFQAEFADTARSVFRLTRHPSLLDFYAPLDPAARISLRVEARGGDHCLLARATQLIPRDAGEVAIALNPASGDLCTLAVAIAGDSYASVGIGSDRRCPATPSSTVSDGTTCVLEVPRGTPVKLQASGDLFTKFERWEGAGECAGGGKAECTLPMNGPAVVRATFH